ncbi:hypothetical protein [Pedobacter sp. JCM 36344]|uniref:hypothetical protein n=1 Tax=Pedobacter sp. JCM 36344 TaxID=3374280 RepID=UPI00397C8CA6
MKLRSGITGRAAESDIQCQKPISHLLVTKIGAAAFLNEIISASISDGNGGQQKVLAKVKIFDAALLSQFENGFLSQTVNADATITSAFIIELTKDGKGLDLRNERYLSIDMESLVLGSTYDINGIESPVPQDRYLDYNTTGIAGTTAQQKSYDVPFGAYEIGVKNNGALSKLVLTYLNGNQISYLPEELAAVTREFNDITLASDTLVEGDAINQMVLAGSALMYYQRLEGVSKFEIHTTGTAELTFILVTEKSL